MSFRRAILLALVFALASPVHAEEPGWYQHKKKTDEKKQQEEQEKAAEKPVVSGPQSDQTSFTQLSANESAPPETNLLFNKKGLTDSLSLDYGSLIQADVGGGQTSLQYGVGWWWKPNLALSGFIRGSMVLETSFLYMQISLGPEIRYFISKDWAVTGLLGYGFSQGLTRVEASAIPPPPNPDTLNLRSGPVLGAQIAYLFWTKRDLAIGPALSYWYGSQGERSQQAIVFGLTYQGGRPNYNGDVTGAFF